MIGDHQNSQHKIEIKNRIDNRFKNKSHILFAGLNGVEICEEFLSLGYLALSLPSFTKALYWLKNQLLIGSDLPIAIISDFALPDGNVFSFHYEIKLNKDLKTIPFIVLAKNRNREDRIKALKVGIDDFYIKNFNATHIHDRIQFLDKFKKLTVDLEPKHEVVLNHFFPTFRMPVFKRIFDVIVSSIALALLSPLFLLISILIKLESKGSVFYISTRAGAGYKIFRFYKFRTMRFNAENELDLVLHLNQYNKLTDSAASFVKIEKDPRITRIGKLLRNTSLDELPQLINVLLGDMSLVGNRPLPLYEAERLTKDQFAKRFIAPAGITGLWQISKRGRIKMSESDRMNLDIAYAEKSSFFYDIQILFKTIPVLFQKESV